jgi:hypothetical protein
VHGWRYRREINVKEIVIGTKCNILAMPFGSLTPTTISRAVWYDLNGIVKAVLSNHYQSSADPTRTIDASSSYSQSLPTSTSSSSPIPINQVGSAWQTPLRCRLPFPSYFVAVHFPNGVSQKQSISDGRTKRKKGEECLGLETVCHARIDNLVEEVVSDYSGIRCLLRTNELST